MINMTMKKALAPPLARVRIGRSRPCRTQRREVRPLTRGRDLPDIDRRKPDWRCGGGAGETGSAMTGCGWRFTVLGGGGAAGGGGSGAAGGGGAAAGVVMAAWGALGASTADAAA
jgi:hypothetical protein